MQVDVGVATHLPSDYLKAGRRSGEGLRHRRGAFPDLNNGRLDGVMTADLTAAQAIAGDPFLSRAQPYYYETAVFAIHEG